MRHRQMATSLLLAASLMSVFSGEARTATHTVSPCDIPRCICSNTHPTLVNNNTDNNRPSLSVTCQVKVVSSRSTAIRSIHTESIKSLTLMCDTDTFLSYLDKDLFSKFSFIESLNIDHCFIKNVEPDFLSGFHNLQELTLHGVTLDQIETSFESKTLKSLTIANSTLETVPYFFNIPNLKKLNISYNYVLDSRMIFPDYNGTTLEHLTSLSVEGNNISLISSSVFSSMPSLVNVLLSKNQIKRLPFPANFSLPNLEVLECLENPLEHLDTNVLRSSVGLRVLKLQGVAEPIDVHVLSSLQNLQELKLSNFNLNSSIWDFLPASSIVYLDLKSNQLESINLTSFTALRLLRLQENLISDLSPGALSSQTSLQLANFTHNKLTVLPESIFFNNKDIKAVLFSGNNIEHLPRNIFSQNPELFYVDFNNNSIRSLPNEIFMPLHKLRFLFLEGNKLEIFPSFPFPCSLQNLHISNNSIALLSESDFVHLTELLILQADNNHIRVIPSEMLSNCPRLLSASFKSNRIWFIGSFKDHPSLQSLNFQDNELTSSYLPSFSRMKDLRFLFLDNNRITRLRPNGFPKSIRVISLSRNSISYIPSDAFSNLPHLTHVALMRNKMVLSFVSTSLSVFSNNAIKPVFLLDFTVLDCTCQLGFLKAWSMQQAQNNLRYVFTKYYPTFSGLKNAYCVSDYFPQEELPFLQVPLDKFVCNLTDEYICDDPICSCCYTHPSSCPCVTRCPDTCACYRVGTGFALFFNVIRCERRGLTAIPSYLHGWAVKFLLDGNNFDTVNASFRNLSNVEELTLNGSHISTIVDNAFDGTKRLQILRLNNNQIHKIGSNTFGNMSTLRELYLNGNRIQVIETTAFDGLTSLQVLHLHTNELVSLDSVLDLPSLQSVTLASNPWSCACFDGWETVKYLYTISSMIMDKNRMCCDDSIPMNFTRDDYVLLSSTNSTESSEEQDHLTSRNLLRIPSGSSNSTKLLKPKLSKSPKGRTPPLSDGFNSSYHSEFNETQLGEDGMRYDSSCFLLFKMSFNLMCTDRYYNYSDHGRAVTHIGGGLAASLMAPLISLAICLTLVAVLIVFVLWKRNVVQAWLYVKVGVRIFDNKAAADKEDKESKPFDVFISFSEKDVGFVANNLVPALEEKRYRVCVHYRDFPVGENICTVIQRAIQYSSRTVLVVSQHFLKSDWCRFEFQTAHHHVLQKGCHRLVIVVLGELPPDDIDPDLRTQMKTKTYLKADDPWFWEKLYFALPDIAGRKDDNYGGEKPELKGMEILSKEADDHGVILEEKHHEVRQDVRRFRQQNCAFGMQEDGAFGIQGNDAFGIQENGAFGIQEDGAFGIQEDGVFGMQEDGAFGIQENGAFGIQENGAFGIQKNGAFNSHENGAFIRQDTGALERQENDAFNRQENGAFNRQEIEIRNEKWWVNATKA